ncbi:hypothetical protein FDO65_09950 [Nakamurella flava]|uniref:Uncharacterized protein n=1 Tax=Nakamurella flava TaxID=2576308 RepID=A0A4U6QN59_9ACTN|nr:hypothetical protein [Nakamurella flava]TKV61839.1 hypothetical protein FDO65_09950 [Nakamurella flava]
MAEGTPTPIEDRSVPMCGACLMALDVVTAEARALVMGERAVDPPDPEDAVEQLRTTRWVFLLDLDDLLEEVKRPDYRYLLASPKNEEN